MSTCMLDGCKFWIERRYEYEHSKLEILVFNPLIEYDLQILASLHLKKLLNL